MDLEADEDYADSEAARIDDDQPLAAGEAEEEEEEKGLLTLGLLGMGMGMGFGGRCGGLKNRCRCGWGFKRFRRCGGMMGMGMGGMGMGMGMGMGGMGMGAGMGRFMRPSWGGCGAWRPYRRFGYGCGFF